MLRLGGPWWPMVAHGGQETPDTPEAMKTVPGLELSDIPKALRCIFNRNVRLSIMIGSRMVQKLWSTLVISSIVCSVRSSLGCCEASVYDHKVFWGIRMAFGFFPFVMMYPQLVSPLSSPWHIPQHFQFFVSQINWPVPHISTRLLMTTGL